jgi:hypothetical protein
VALTANHCKSGMYLGYAHDAAGANNTQGCAGMATKLGKALEVITLGTPLSGGGIAARLALSVPGSSIHKVMHYPLVPTGGTLALAATGSYDAIWDQAAADIVASPFNGADLTIALGWEGGAGGYGGSFPWVIGTGSDTSKAGTFATAYARCVTRFRNAGVSLSVTWEWNVHSQGTSAAQLAAAYPGDAYVDIVGWDCYAGNHYGNNTVARTNYQTIWDNQHLPALLILETFARQHGKRCGASEFGMVQPVAGNTTSNAYVYQAADTALYYQLMATHMAANADLWAYTVLFNQNQTSGGNITEDDQLFYCGTNPATQTYPALASTSVTNGTWYDTTSPQHVLDLPAWKAYHAQSLDYVAPVTVASLQAQVATLTSTNSALLASNATLTAANATLTGQNTTLTAQVAAASGQSLVSLLQQVAAQDQAVMDLANSDVAAAAATLAARKAVVDDQASRIARINAAIAAVQ